MIILQLTEQEALSLRNLLDLAVKAGGMRAAEFAVPLDAKILQAAKALQPVQSPQPIKSNDVGVGLDAFPTPLAAGD